MRDIDWKNIKFIARPDTWYDEGTEAVLNTFIQLNECI